MDDLVTWLRAQLDEDARVVAAAAPTIFFGEWEARDVGEPGGPSVWEGTALVARPLSDEHAEFIACWHPQRATAEILAKRRILDACESHSEAQFPDSYGGYASAMEDALQILALPYADRPGYRNEWRPTA